MLLTHITEKVWILFYFGYTASSYKMQGVIQLNWILKQPKDSSLWKNNKNFEILNNCINKRTYNIIILLIIRRLHTILRSIFCTIAQTTVSFNHCRHQHSNSNSKELVSLKKLMKRVWLKRKFGYKTQRLCL